MPIVILVIIIRFAVNGTIDARNGNSYSASSYIAYEANHEYTFGVHINFTTKTYTISFHVDGETIILGENYDFRSEQSDLNTSNKMADYSRINGVVHVKDVSIAR